jgi:hypothetical protein
MPDTTRQTVINQPAALYLIGVIVLSAIGVGGLVAIEWLRPGDYNTAIIGQIIGLIGPSIIGLMVLLRSVHNGQAIEEVKQTAVVAANETRVARHEVPAKTAEAVRGVLAEASREPPR